MNGMTSVVYEIRVRGSLTSELWARQFEGLEIKQETPGITTLTGEIEDQAALYGLLSRLRNLALPLLSVRILEVRGQAGK